MLKYAQTPVRRRGSVAAVSAVAIGAVSLAVFSAAPSATAGSLSGTLYRETTTKVAQWVAANPSDYRTSVISSKIANQPAAKWISSYNPSTVQSEVSGYVTAANNAGIPSCASSWRA